MKPLRVLLVVAGASGLTVAGVVLATRYTARRGRDATRLTSAASWLRQRVLVPIQSRLGATNARTDQADAASSQTRNRAKASFIGNTQTRVYHEASDAQLPAEQHRAYFTSAEEAEAVGYRPAGNPS